MTGYQVPLEAAVFGALAFGYVCLWLGVNAGRELERRGGPDDEDW